MTKQRSSLKPNDELSFLISCCQTSPSQKNIQYIISYLNTHDDEIQNIITLALAHGILPLVYKTIISVKNNLSIKIKSKETMCTSLKLVYLEIVQKNMLMTSELIRITTLLRQNHLHVLAFKGPTLSKLAYGDIISRQYVDIDVLVDQKDVLSVAKLLTMHHFVPLISLDMLKNPTCLKIGNDFSLVHATNGVHIELHWKLFPNQFLTNFYDTNLSHISNTLSINNVPISTLSNEQLVVYLCIHGSKHAWERIEWICDIDRFILSTEGDIDWDMVLNIAKDTNSSRMLFLGLGLSHKYFSTPLPINVTLEDTLSLPPLINHTINIMNDNLIFKEGFTYLRTIRLYQMKLLVSKNEKYLYITKKLFQLSIQDCNYIKFPASLSFLYILLRPARLLHKYFKSHK